MKIPLSLRRSVIAIVSLMVAFIVVVWLYSGSSPRATFLRLVARFEHERPISVDGDTVIALVFDHQDHSLSCEVAALKMALAYRKEVVSEQELIDAVGTDSTSKTTVAGKTVWGDPTKAFVGNIDGKMLIDGYGVDWQPIERVAKKWRRVAGFSGGTPQLLAEAIADGNPVVAWGYTVGGGAPAQWYTPDGKLVKAVNGEHAFVVHGFRGSTDSPEGFFIMDPVYGERYMSTAAFLRNWGTLDNSGVIVY